MQDELGGTYEWYLTIFYIAYIIFEWYVNVHPHRSHFSF